MKVRTGFVSNSSSSSFCIFGTSFDLEKLEEENIDVYNNRHIKEDDFELHMCGRNEDYYPMYLGLEPEDMREDETKAQFRDRVYDNLVKFCEKYEFDIPKKEYISFVTDGWYNG